MAHLGVTTPIISTVLSIFMAGLAIGSWLGGRTARKLAGRPVALALQLYATAELLIALSVYAVPAGLAGARRSLAAGSWASGSYFAGAALWTTALLLPFCTAMGATLPLAMWAIRSEGSDSESSFSRLYLANVVGATLGTAGSALILIEILGFEGTLHLAAGLNALIAAAALALSLVVKTRAAQVPDVPNVAAQSARPDRIRANAILFATGCASLGMEVVWIRQLTPYLGNVVYTFALILCCYLIATYLGTAVYRGMRRRLPPSIIASPWPWLVLSFASLLPAVLADPRLAVPVGFLGALVRVTVGLAPFCALLGFLTPLVVDRTSGGDPGVAGSVYAVNVLGGIVGPLVSGFVLLPILSESWSLLVFATGLLALAAWPAWSDGWPRQRPRLGLAAIGAAGLVAIATGTRGYEDRFGGATVRRDHTATVTALGTGMNKSLLVNGVGMTYLTPITKMMAHLPLALLDRKPESGLVVCLGMGTTFRSVHSWGVEATVVELVPSVPALLGYFHADAEALARSPRAHIVVDDGRRFLEFRQGRYDVIVIDPPPPPEAAGSSLLYSVEFYDAARRRVKPGGIVQQWIPDGDALVVASFARAFAQSFPHVRAFSSIEGWGVHLLGSDSPIVIPSADALAQRLPETARRDLVEWQPTDSPANMLRIVLAREIPILGLTRLAPGAQPLRDDRPINEYFLVRRAAQRLR